MIGVSPAYFVSRFGTRFTPEEMAAGLEEIKEIGYRGFQLEVFHRETLNDWVARGGPLVRRKAAELELQAGQLVAHFMLQDFADPENLFSDSGLAEMAGILEFVGCFPDCGVVTVPLGAFETGSCHFDDYRPLFQRCAEKIDRMLTMVEKSGRRMALEVLPGALIGGVDGFLRLCDRVGTDSLGFNFDTGHARAAKENLCLIPAKLGHRILGTHLCDNFGHENLSLRPGTGSINWPEILAAMKSSGYRGSLDIEIICSPEDAVMEYRQAHRFLENLLNRPGTFPAGR